MLSDEELLRLFTIPGTTRTEGLRTVAEAAAKQALETLTKIADIEPEVIDSWGVVQFTVAQTNAIGHLVAEFRSDEREARAASISTDKG